MTKEYLEDAKKFGARIGDKVTVICSYPNPRHANGWENGWISEMNQYIGRSGTLINIREEGHYIDFGPNDHTYGFPWFSLAFVR